MNGPAAQRTPRPRLRKPLPCATMTGSHTTHSGCSITPKESTPRLSSNMTASYINMSDPKAIPRAEAALKKSIDLSPSYPAYANLGILYSQQKRYEESAAATEKALQLNDQNYRV